MRKWFEACKKLSIIVAEPTSPSQLSSYSPFLSVELFCMATHQGGVLLFLGPEQDCCLPHGSPQPPPTFSMLASQTLVPGKKGGQEHVQSCKHVHLHCCLSANIGISVGDSSYILPLYFSYMEILVQQRFVSRGPEYLQVGYHP